MYADDAMELRITWDEIQELLRPSPTAKPKIIKIEDAEFEEYEVSATKYWKATKIVSFLLMLHCSFFIVNKV